MDVAELLGQIAVDGDYNPFSLRNLGPEGISMVRGALSSPSLREAALAVLATLREPFDFALVPQEKPLPMDACEFWYAVPTGDQEAVLDVFGLSSPVPVTMRMGRLAWRYGGHRWWLDHGRCSVIYVSSVLDGWTLVFGEPSEDFHTRGTLADGVEDPYGVKQMRANEAATRIVRRDRCAALSRRFGAAHLYLRSHGDSTTSRLIAEDGAAVRWYDVEVPEEQIGPPHPGEAGFRLPHEENPWPDGSFDDIIQAHVGKELALRFRDRYRRLRAEYNVPENCNAYDVAAQLSVRPGDIGPSTVVKGHGVLARTGCPG
ncbi:hypothetical protein QRX50_08075 [Amycolatopsis carbonis]|uniref:Uncharacterized protein n=1 Tax=Amycolatopsis carbonis TaxID=715471 RepID=A0A9Y2MTI5_9PSEU|nr:hypothetical protein [Amycolatopsis sp. 2-15]WIX80710.1 hypothetical protein QRX50_08075 [Amycolatopsis sp. 2-15]